MKERKLFFPAVIGGAFMHELREAGLSNIPVSVMPKGLNFSPEVSDEDIQKVLDLIAHHDPEKPDPEAYKIERKKSYPQTGDQLDVAYKDRANRRFITGKIKEALSEMNDMPDDLRNLFKLIIRALDLGDEADLVDGRISSVRRKFQPEDKL